MALSAIWHEARTLLRCTHDRIVALHGVAVKVLRLGNCRCSTCGWAGRLASSKLCWLVVQCDRLLQIVIAGAAADAGMCVHEGRNAQGGTQSWQSWPTEVARQVGAAAWLATVCWASATSADLGFHFRIQGASSCY